ncbi:hypothetical protein [Paraburkholderia unamae]|uniref:hypothetical protein n=1 Tax=Paraburkholderia unamae TaxID=219649 RepID=UPI001057E7E3|nr:hypothetical protein [Paraburkholderia unamae]CAG9266954.1 conserved hypothetical protein [Paraburkholderia unamae]
MNKRNPRCVFIAYDEDNQQLETYTIDRDAVAKLKEAALVMPWPLAEHKLDDEFARKLGGAIFNLLAIYQPALKPLISVTPDPDSSELPPSSD